MALMRSRGEQRAAVLEEQLSYAKRMQEEVEMALWALTTRVTELGDGEADARRRVSELERELQVAESRIVIAESKEKALRGLNDAKLAQSLVHRDERENALRRVETLKLMVGSKEEEILRLKRENQEMHSIVLDQGEGGEREQRVTLFFRQVGHVTFFHTKKPSQHSGAHSSTMTKP